LRKLEAISILTNSGRLIISIRIGEYQKVRLDRIRGQADLILREGIVYLATDNEGETFSGKQIDHVREKNAKLRANLQKCGFSGNADHIAAINIAAKATVNQPIIACDEVKAVIGIEMEHSYKPLSSGAFDMPPVSTRGN
jgi:hypothetical protein